MKADTAPQSNVSHLHGDDRLTQEMCGATDREGVNVTVLKAS